MKSFLKGLCLLLALMSTTGTVVAKDSATAPVKKTELSDKVVNLNKADANTLRYYLKGIGEVKADAIIQFRKDNGKFSSIDDLLKVPGIGAATFKGLKKNVSTSRGESTAPKLPVSGTASKAKKTSSSTSSKKTSSLLDKSSDKDAGKSESESESESESKTKKPSDDKSSATKTTKKVKADNKTANKTDTKKTAKAETAKQSKTAKCDPKKDKGCKAKKVTKKKASTKKAKTKSKKTTSKSKTKKKEAK